MQHIDKIRLYSKFNKDYRYPDATGHFYIHRVGHLYIWDTMEFWQSPFLFSFVPAVVQHWFGELDADGNEIYVGNLTVMEIANCLYQKTIWNQAIKS